MWPKQRVSRVTRFTPGAVAPRQTWQFSSVMVRAGRASWLIHARETAFIGAVHDVRLGLALDHRFVDDDLGHVAHRRQLVHGVEQHRLQNGTQAARAGLALHRPMRDGAQRLVTELQLRTFHLEQAPILLGERVLRLGENRDECALVQLIERRDYRQTADKFRDQAVLDQVLGLDVVEQIAAVRAGIDVAHLRRKADARLLRAIQDDLLEARKGTAADKQDVAGVDLQEFLLRMLTAALRWHRRNRALDELEQRLLHALAGNVARDRRVVGLARDLVDLVDVNDAGLRLLDVVVALLQQLLDDVLHVLADVAGLGEGGRIRDRKRHIEQASQRLRQQRLAAAGRTDQEDVALGNLHLFFGARAAAAGLQALVVVVHHHREHLLGALLTDDVFVQDLLDLVRLGQLVAGTLGAILELLADDVVAQLDAFVADEYRRAGDQFADFVLTLAAERAIQQLAVVVAAAGVLTHRCPS